MKYRIVRRDNSPFDVKYVIQRQRFTLFRKREVWDDVNWSSYLTRFDTLAEADQFLNRVINGPTPDEVVG
jgi:hypothetical protein